jgi:DNA repair protein RadC
MDQIDRQLAVNLAMLINEVGSKAVLLAVPRQRGTPHEPDRQLWRDMQELLAHSPIELLDLLVVGPRHTWSAREALE